MSFLLLVSRTVDGINAYLGRFANLMILGACLVSAGNALMRYGFDLSNNWQLELQWYMFAAAVMLGASHTLARNEHVRVDLIYAHLPYKGRIAVDIFGLVCFLLPACILFTWLAWTSLFLPSFAILEESSNSGGLIRYPVKFLVPLGFFFITLQGISELIKRIAVLRGYDEAHIGMINRYERPEQ